MPRVAHSRGGGGGVERPADKIVKQRCREILVVSIKRGAVIERKDVAERGLKYERL